LWHTPLKICKSSPQPLRVKLIDGKHTDAALRTAWPADQPLAAATRGVGQCGIHNL